MNPKEHQGKIVVHSIPTKEDAHETYDDSFGLSSRNQFIDGSRSGSGWRSSRRYWQLSGHRYSGL
jgi:hypothetical protein